MKKLVGLALVSSLVLIMASCGSGAKDKKADLGDKKVQLEKLKKQKNDLDGKIRQLEQEIAKADPNASSVKKLVSVDSVTSQDFIHYVDLQGKIDAKNVAYVAPQGQPGLVKSIFVTKGQAVKKGQLLLKLDDVLVRQAAAAKEQEIAGLEAAAKLKQSIYERRQNLWKENIGSEVEVLSAKTEAEAAASQLSAARAGLRAAREQVNQSNVYAEISGTIDELNVRVGETFTGMAGNKPQITIVNTGDLKAYAQVPENYLSKVHVGTPIQVVLPELNNRAISTKVSVASKLIDPVTRSFYVEGQLPVDKDLRPNQAAVIKIEDYKKQNAITVPVNIVQSDEKGKYLYVVATENGKTVARRRTVILGESYGGAAEIISGLKAGEQIITEGYQTLYDGQAITTTK